MGRSKKKPTAHSLEVVEEEDENVPVETTKKRKAPENLIKASKQIISKSEKTIKETESLLRTMRNRSKRLKRRAEELKEMSRTDRQLRSIQNKDERATVKSVINLVETYRSEHDPIIGVLQELYKATQDIYSRHIETRDAMLTKLHTIEWKRSISAAPCCVPGVKSIHSQQEELFG